MLHWSPIPIKLMTPIQRDGLSQYNVIKVIMLLAKLVVVLYLKAIREDHLCLVALCAIYITIDQQ